MSGDLFPHQSADREITSPVEVLVTGNHREELAFKGMKFSQIPVVLGGPWLIFHKPHVDWEKETIREWSPSCHMTRLRLTTFSCNSVPSVTEESSDMHLLALEYRDLSQSFSKSRAYSQPLHQAYNCAIELLPRSAPPRGHLYSVCSRNQGHGGMHLGSLGFWPLVFTCRGWIIR